MGGYISLAATRGCRATVIFCTAALALWALLLSFAGSASAAPAAGKVFPANSEAGLTEPSGLAVTPDGTVWASDALLGVCRDGIELPPPDPERPAAAFQMAFDATDCPKDADPSDHTVCNFYVAEGSSGGSGVWRMHWNSEKRAIDAATKIYDDSTDQRIMGLALAPGGAVDFAAKRNNEIRRIENAATASIGVATKLIGSTFTGEQASSLANLGGKIYLVEGGRLSVIDVPDGRLARPLADPSAGAVASSVVADPDRDVLFVGTSRSTLTDEVLTLRDGTFLPGAYDHDFANVTAMALAPDGGLYVVHDPFAALSPGVDTPGQGEVFLRAKTEPNPPDVTFTAQPAAVVKSGTLSFAFKASTAPAAASFRCRVDDGAPFACDSGRYQTDALVEGAHSLSVWAANGTSPAAGDFGVAEQVGFTIDDTKPEIAIDPRTSTTAVGGNLRLLFTASDKTPMAYTCRVDGGAAFGCGSPEDLVLALGTHTITVTATDAAGNVSDAVDWTVTAVPAPPVPVVTVPGGGATVTYRAPAKARFVKFTLRRTAGRRSGRIVETLGYARVRRAGDHRSSVVLTTGQRRMVRGGRLRLAVAYGTCRTQVGRWQWVPESDDSAREGQR